MTTTATAGETAPAFSPAMSREVLEDRYRAAIDKRTKPGNYSRLGQDLANAVHGVIARVARLEDGRDLTGTGGVEEAVMATVRETVIREIESRGLAR